MQDINEYALSTAFDASTAVFVDATSVSSKETAPGMAFSNDGAKMFMWVLPETINEYALSTAFDASTATFVDATSVSSQEADPQGMAFSSDGAKETAPELDSATGMAFSSDGAKMFVTGSDGDDVNEYALSTAFDSSPLPPLSMPSPSHQRRPFRKAWHSQVTAPRCS